MAAGSWQGGRLFWWRRLFVLVRLQAVDNVFYYYLHLHAATAPCMQLFPGLYQSRLIYMHGMALCSLPERRLSDSGVDAGGSEEAPAASLKPRKPCADPR